ncbi:DUF2169 domain-containing protein [Rhizobacter sp. OV335]|uniref:DUF2169 family type VI secretion system accessory protein n=1 Tax=Rhizobacter sp. OV335 TaxID=1500264 RepID=UPI000936491B|nr:DUF2169 domain-containing protein [Rhizobacter sp. OV335]
MWTLINQTPFAAERTFVTDERGADVMLVLVKASYQLMPDGRTEVDPQQLPVFFEPRFRGDPHVSSLLSESDLDFPKRTTDVLLVGSAHAPGGVPCTEVEVSMQVGPVRKALRVVGDRVWKSGLLGPRPGPPVLFVTMPITYERAFGGREQGSPTQFEPRNPVGTGFARHAEGMHGQPVANVSYAGHEFARWDDRPAPAGFGPVARHWQPRAGHAGTFDLAWEQERFPLRPLDFDLRFHQSAPADQQPPGLPLPPRRCARRPACPAVRGGAGARRVAPRDALGLGLALPRQEISAGAHRRAAQATRHARIASFASGCAWLNRHTSSGWEHERR